MSDKEYTAEIQKLLIQGLISDGTMFTRAQSILKPEYFDNQLKNTVKFILEYTEKYSTIPSTEQIEAHTSVRIDKLSEFNEQHQTSFLDEIQDFCRHKALVHAILKSADLLEKGNPAGIEEMIKEAILIGLTKSLGTDYFEDPRARLLKLKDENGTISTGWRSVDKTLYNVGRGELLLFLALSGGGKSVALQNLTLNFALQDLNVVYITLELSEELCAKRIDSMSCDITASDIYKKLDEVEIKVKSLGNRTGDITIKYMASNTTCTRDIRSYLKEYEIQKGFKPDVLVLDYIDLLAPNDKRISPSDLFIKDKFISEELRNMAKEYQLLVATASQLNRCLDLFTVVDIENKGKIFIKDVSVGDKIKSKNGYNTILAKTEPERQETYKITLESGKTIICSKRHLFPTATGDLCIGDGLNVGDELFTDD